MSEDSVIYHQHNDHRNCCCKQKGFCIPYGHISRKTVTSIIHTCTNALKHCISEDISNQCSNQCNKNRKCHIMKNQFPPGISGCTECTDNAGFFSNGIADGNSKYKCHDHHNNIKQHDHHRLITAHIISGKNNCLIQVLRYKSFQCNDFSDIFHQFFGNFLFLLLCFRFLIIYPGIIVL